MIFGRKEVVVYDVKYCQVSAHVRYWEDAKINGEDDGDPIPKMPFRDDEMWKPLIDLDEGRIVDWPEGLVANVHYKVCDAGEYDLLDKNKKVIATYDGYVPDVCDPMGEGYSDYIILDIDGTGKITNWDKNNITLSEFDNEE